MISHKYKFIFVHVPKCAGSSVRDYYFDTPKLDWSRPNYDVLYGWCPKRKIHLQHATPKELIETDLISKEVWDAYFKFAFVRNPWDRAYSDYLWVQKDSGVIGSFKNYLKGAGRFELIMKDQSIREYRGDHLTSQVEYVANETYQLDFVGRFESLVSDIRKISEKLNFKKEFDVHEKKSVRRFSHYSKFYTSSNKRLIDEMYKLDIDKLDYIFEDKRRGLYLLKRYL